MSFALVKYLPTGTEYGFIRLRRMALLVSIALMLGSVGAYFGLGINFGIDFRVRYGCCCSGSKRLT